jgi:secreted protein with Ig-like and vWFA domain
MKEILRFNTTDKRMEDRLKDASSRGLVYNTLKTREGYYARLEKFRAANPNFLDEI